MQKPRVKYYLRLLLLAAVVAGGITGTALATTSTSNNYQATEMEFGSGANVNSCSGQYCARVSIGDMTDGKEMKTESTAAFGNLMDNEPRLEMIVDPGPSSLGVLTTEHTATKETTVRVLTYLSTGYELQIIGDPPRYDNHTLETPTTPTASTAGIEQFAINAAVNTSPNIGKALVQVPSGEFSFGTLTENYSQPNLFKYTSGDVIARSLSASGRTDYTISMIVNISNNTPAGHYTGEFAAVAIPIF